MHCMHFETTVLQLQTIQSVNLLYFDEDRRSRSNRHITSHHTQLVTTSHYHKNVVSTLRYSQAVSHPSTNRALCCFTLEFEWDPVLSTQYGRQPRDLPFHMMGVVFLTFSKAYYITLTTMKHTCLLNATLTHFNTTLTPL